MPEQHLVAVVGAGPAGIYGARKLAEAGHRVVLLNRDIKPGGLAEYGIYVEKEKMKTGLRKQFKKILADPKVFYLGHVTIGQNQALTLNDLRTIGFGVIVVTAGAQGTKKLGIEGEDTLGVYHAKDVVYHYNSLPPFSQSTFEIGRRVAIIGMGNVMVDIANWLLNLKKIDQVVVVARRGPIEKAYDDNEFEYIEQYLDNADMKQEIERIAPHLAAVGQNVDEILKKFVKEGDPAEGRRLTFRYLCSPTKVIANEQGRVAALEAEDNEMILQDGRTVAKGTGKSRRIEVDCVIYAIGDQVDVFVELFCGVCAEDYFAVAGAVELDVGIIFVRLGGADVAEKHGAIDGIDEGASAAMIGRIKPEGFFGQAGGDEGLDDAIGSPGLFAAGLEGDGGFHGDGGNPQAMHAGGI